VTAAQAESPDAARETDWGATALRLSYPGVLALADVSLAAPRGQVTAVVGGDGAGKTSLLRCLGGAARPQAGEVRGPGPLRTGYLPASSGLYPDLTVTENLEFRATAYGVTAAAAQSRIAELIERAGLADARDRLTGQLSGGMRQKLGVIAALLPEPDLVILDEPSTGVDPVSRSGLWSLIASAAAGGAAVVLATTYLDDAARAAWVLVLDAGRALTAGTPEDIVAGMPGTIVAVTDAPEGNDGSRAWRRSGSWRIWCQPGTSQPGPAVTADLQDAVTVAALSRELSGSSAAANNLSPAPSRPPRGHRRTESATGALAPLAETAHVTCRFGRITAVRDVSIEIGPGEIVGLIGANGAGKTTLIRLLLGLTTATSGDVRLLGAAPSRDTRRRIGYVPQGLGLYEDLTAAENMEFAAAVFGAADGGHRAGKSRERSTPIGQLSLGLQRRTAFAQALAHNPELLILDEPTSGVDPLGRARLWQTIAGAVRAGAGALVSTHYLEEAAECDRLIIMADGAVVAAGTAADIVGDAQSTVVETADWAAAFSRLERAGLPVALAGRTLRLPGISPAEAERVLAGQSPTADYRLYSAPATLEERFFELASAGGAAEPAQVPA
jgi:ABC-2 type transport system ATP-binding protein